MADNFIDSNKQQNAHGTKKTSRKEAFTIDFGNGTDSSLQESFLRFKKARQKEIAKRRKVRRARLKRQKNPRFQAELRQKFINQAKKYFGYPYARKYWPKDSEEYNSKLFLDCCGLVRQVVRDLAKDFGFVIGPWNQAYMYDTLPHTVESEADMKPGDLVFMSGTYVNPKSTNQKHFMTHVEIWLGDGPKTIGARWNNGKVQIWNHYKFEAKSFTNTVYHFKSIDTWLKGICKSYCPEHKWKRSKFKPGKKSIFRDKEQKKDATKPQTGEQTAEQVEEQVDELADKPADEADEEIDQEQDNIDEEQDDVDEDDTDDLDQDDFDQELGDGDEDQEPVEDEPADASDQEETTQISTSNPLPVVKKCCSDSSIKKENGIDLEKKNGKRRDFNLQQSETTLLHKFDEKEDFNIRKTSNNSLKAGCDSSNNANGDNNCDEAKNSFDDVSKELAIQLSETSIHSSSSFTTGGRN